MTVPRNTGWTRGSASYAFWSVHLTRCPPRGWAPILQKRSVTRTDRFQNQMVVTGDSFLGVRFLSTESDRVIGVQCCLGCTVRSQGFAPSQRFSPTRTLWLCFTPHPSLGFRSSELIPHRQPRYLSISVALLPFRQRPGVAGKPVPQVRPYRLSPASPIFNGELCRVPVAHPCIAPDISLAGHPTCAGTQVWRAARAIQRVDARHSPGSRLTSNE